MEQRPMVVKVDKEGFELSDGRVFEHPEPLNSIPTVEEFQAIYDSWREVFIQGLHNPRLDRS